MSDGLQLPIPSEILDDLAERVAAKLADRIQPPAAEPLPGTNGRLALRKTEAADAIGVSVDYLEQKVIPELRTIRDGRLRLIPVAELERWVREHAARPLDGLR